MLCLKCLPGWEGRCVSVLSTFVFQLSLGCLWRTLNLQADVDDIKHQLYFPNLSSRMSPTLAAMGDSMVTDGQSQWSGSAPMPRPPQGPYISVITNRLALLYLSRTTWWVVSNSQNALLCCPAVQDGACQTQAAFNFQSSRCDPLFSAVGPQTW